MNRLLTTVLFSFSGLSTALVVSGCLKPSAKVALATHQRQSTDRVALATLVSADGLIRQDNSGVRAAVATFADEGANADRVALSIRDEYLVGEDRWRSLANAVLAAGSRAADGFAPGAGSFVRDLQFATNQMAVEMERLKINTLSREQIVALLDIQHKSLSERISTVDKERDALQRSVESLRARLTDEFNKLKFEDQDRWKRDVLQTLRDQGVSQDQLKKYEGMSPAELLALLASGGTGAVALMRTFGKSRSQPDVDALYDKAEALAKALAVLEVKTAAVANSKPPSPGTSA